MNQFLILIKKDMIELYRTKKLLIIGIIFVLFAILSPVTAYLTPNIIEMLSKSDPNVIITVPDPTYIDSYIQFFNNFSQMCTLVVIIVFAPLIVEEKRKGTFHTLLNNKVSRSNFVISKIISQLKSFTFFYIVSILIFMLYTYILFEQTLAPYWLLSFTSLYIYFIFLIGIINLMSVITKTNIMSIVASLAVFFSIMILNFIPIIGKYLPNYLITISNNLIIDNSYLQYVVVNYIVTLTLFVITVMLSIKLCHYED